MLTSCVHCGTPFRFQTVFPWYHRYQLELMNGFALWVCLTQWMFWQGCDSSSIWTMWAIILMAFNMILTLGCWVWAQDNNVHFEWPLVLIVHNMLHSYFFLNAGESCRVLMVFFGVIVSPISVAHRIFTTVMHVKPSIQVVPV